MSIRMAHIPRRSSWRVGRAGQRALTYTLLAVAAVLVFVPFYWLVRSSLMVEGDHYVWPPILWPNPIVWQTYAEIFQIPYIPMLLFLRNSVVLVIVCCIGEVIASSLVGFALARLRWWGRNLVFALCIATMFLPTQVTIVPLFLAFKRLGWLDTLIPLILPSWFGHAFHIFMMRQFVLGIPLELDDAMRIDGGGPVRIYYSLILPLSKPALVAVALMQFQAKWNQFFEPLIYITDMRAMPLAVGVHIFQVMVGADALGLTRVGWNHVMAATVVLVVPIIIVFVLGQRAFIQGIATTGLNR